MRPPTGTRFWLGVASSFALVVVVLSSPIRAPQVPDAADYPTLLYRNFALISDESKPAFTLAAPDRQSVDAADRDPEEEDEDKLFWSFSRPVCPISTPSGPSSGPLSRPSPGTSPLRTAAVPLRC